MLPKWAKVLQGLLNLALIIGLLYLVVTLNLLLWVIFIAVGYCLYLQFFLIKQITSMSISIEVLKVLNGRQRD